MDYGQISSLEVAKIHRHQRVHSHLFRFLHGEFRIQEFVLVDNESIVHSLRSKTSRDPIFMSMVRRVVVLSMLYNIQFSSFHVPGRHNVIADLCSRFQVEKA